MQKGEGGRGGGGVEGNDRIYAQWSLICYLGLSIADYMFVCLYKYVYHVKKSYNLWLSVLPCDVRLSGEWAAFMVIRFWHRSELKLTIWFSVWQESCFKLGDMI